MENDPAMLYCPNEDCLAANPLNHNFCHQCSTALPKRYLWVVGDDLSMKLPGEILGDRYLIITQSVVLDTKPSLPPQMPESLADIKAYLRLVPYSLNIPQIYGILPYNTQGRFQGAVLLEQPPLSVDGSGLEVTLCTPLTTAWGNATAMRQLNWLWQMAQLWQPLRREGVVSSLINAQLVRVQGGVVRLLELVRDSQPSPNLPQLGEFWQQLTPESRPPVTGFITEVVNGLVSGKISSPEQLIGILDQGLTHLGDSQSVRVKVVTKTDTGPRRAGNEDACYPVGGTVVSSPPEELPVVIVCDGIGGHQGGSVASNLAVETVYHELHQMNNLTGDGVPHNTIPERVVCNLERAVGLANNQISDRNDTEHRQGRERMGTTLVMALPVGHQMYVTHVGDSRAYWITRQGCYQVTLDDDVASREVRLGYAIYRQALQYRGAGSLVQALGMGDSSSLHPTSQRFILDEDGIFLLTSDGLSDFDRIEDYWQTEILPVLTSESDIVSVADRLVELANTKNGHDNVTLALIHYQVEYADSLHNVAIPDLSLKDLSSWGYFSSTDSMTCTQRSDSTLLDAKNDQKTQVIPRTRRWGIAKLPLNLIVPLLLLMLAGFLGFWVKGLISPPIAVPNPTMTDEAAPSPNRD